MHTTRLSSKGQVILPKAVRERLHLTPGTAFSVELADDAVVLRPARTSRPRASLQDVVGILATTGPPRTVEEMTRAIETEIRHRHDRGRY